MYEQVDACVGDNDVTIEAVRDFERRGNSQNRPFSGDSLYVMRPDGSGVVRVLDGGDVALLPSSWTP